jgi:hypothetical protein
MCCLAERYEDNDRWTWLVVLAYTQLRLARPLASDQPLAWQRPLHVGHLTPARVQRAFSALLLRLLRLPILASPPKPCGRSPGRPKGKRSGRATRYPAITIAALCASQVAWVRLLFVHLLPATLLWICRSPPRGLTTS